MLEERGLRHKKNPSITNPRDTIRLKSKIRKPSSITPLRPRIARDSRPRPRLRKNWRRVLTTAHPPLLDSVLYLLGFGWAGMGCTSLFPGALPPFLFFCLGHEMGPLGGGICCCVDACELGMNLVYYM
ncbi:hypothetical protein COCSADRAFT_220353 [Bipolaris sorokiniana ND90Pr]|uniref:Uncharacterized protein n=1 Tax=Cochliobolus sativus (strain ND90Pr / ATCC 201652) TaxID=665912 RepID=M2S5H0_COCSN|nr:uncharacterized protein COCSADRAFT_220353 [Bipolaris sorokiniana ND90Pr]EMD62403.1 hypothetical protein COCSADRAFT_220353 [Bipolaris sorokiniana ND90Pr]